MGFHFGPEATNLMALIAEVPVDLINNWLKGIVLRAKGNGTAKRSAAGLHKYMSSDTFSVVLISTGERERFVWGQELHYEGHKSLLAFSPCEIWKENEQVGLRNGQCSGKCGPWHCTQKSAFLLYGKGEEGRIKGFERAAMKLLKWAEKKLLKPKPLQFFALYSRNICLLLTHVQYSKEPTGPRLAFQLSMQWVPKLNLIENLALNDVVSLDTSVIHSMLFFSLWANNLQAKTSKWS